MKKLAIIVPTLHDGGAEKVAALTSRCLSDVYEVFIIVNQIKKQNYDFSGKIIVLNSKPAKSYIGKLMNIMMRTYKVKRLKIKNNIDISISFMEGSNFINILSKNKEKTIISVHTNISEQNNRYILSKFTKLFIKCLYNYADHIICVSQYIALDLSKNYNIQQKRLEVLYNPIDIKEINILRNKPFDQDDVLDFKKIYAENHIIIFVGRLVSAKALSNLLKSFYILKQTMQNVKLVIIGDGDKRTNMLDITKHFAIEDDVFYLGYKQNPYPYITRSDLFALTSIREGMPNILLEAMACGLPILSTNCKTGPVELLNNTQDYNYGINKYWKAKYGVLTNCFRCDEYDDMIEESHVYYAEAMMTMLTDDMAKSQYRLAVQQRVREFDILHFRRKLVDLIEQKH